jgi:hypothetical protein
MSDDAYQATTSALADHEAVRPGVGIPASAPLREPAFKRILGAIPPSDKEILADADHGIAAVANGNAMKRSEARRDAILAVSLAIVRRGQNPVTDWSTKDTDTAYAIADQLIALS